jgi:hypothetical protein
LSGRRLQGFDDFAIGTFKQIAVSLIFLSNGSLLGLALLVPFAQIPGPQLFGITSLFCGGTFVAELITAVLLLSRFKENRRRSFLVLAAGNAYTAAIVVAMILCFPDVLERGRAIIGGATDLAAWVFQLWVWGIAIVPLLAARDELRSHLVAEEKMSFMPLQSHLPRPRH